MIQDNLPMIGFKPILQKNTKVLILGSFPGIASLKKQEYYGHPRNLFWQFMEEIIGENLVEMNYQKKLKHLQKNNIGLWDVIQTCSREGSLDSSIKEEQQNQFKILNEKAPNIKHIFFNGKKAGKCQVLLNDLGYATTILPSSSPANAGIPLTVKQKEWKKIGKILLHKEN